MCIPFHASIEYRFHCQSNLEVGAVIPTCTRTTSAQSQSEFLEVVISRSGGLLLLIVYAYNAFLRFLWPVLLCGLLLL